MKVGLSYSRCVRDIVEANVLFEDVLVIIARTDFNPHDDNHWQSIWSGYTMGGYSQAEWANAEVGLGTEHNAEEMYRNVSKQLYDSGKLHQPRQFGAHPSRLPYHWLECFVPDSELLNKPAVKKAWDSYKMIANLS